jgi:mannose-6-phosphate isomerase-like protein (cupin superfamily)
VRCVIPVDLSRFPAGTHTETLAGPHNGFTACYVLFSRSETASPPEQLHSLRADHIYFVICGQLSLQLAEHEIRVDAGTLVRVPKGAQHCAWNQAEGDALYLEVIAPAFRRHELATQGLAHEPIDLTQVVQKDTRNKFERSKTGFDYKFLASRALGSEHVAINVATVQPGHQGPDFHIHTFDQFYFVLRGQLTIDVGFERLEAGPLSLVVLPAGIIHRQRNEGREPEEHLSIITPEPAADRRLDHQVAMPRQEGVAPRTP